MELCTIRVAHSTPPLPLSSTSHRRFLPSTPHLSFQKLPFFSGVLSVSNTTTSSRLVRASFDESSSKFTDEKNETAVATLEDDASSKFVNVGMNEEEGGVYNEPVQELFNNLNIDLDVEDSPTILLYGSGALVAVWLLSAIVGAIDSIPVFPKLMEVVGLGYSVWFTTRYLLFKKNREELGSKINQLKQEIIGSSDK